MEIKEIIDQNRILEKTILAMIEDFEKLTGIVVSDITVERVNAYDRFGYIVNPITGIKIDLEFLK